MKSRLIWAALMLGAIVGFYFATIRPAMDHAPRKIKLPAIKEFRAPEFAPPPLPPPNIAMPTIPPPPPDPTPHFPPVMAHRRGRGTPVGAELPIQNRATIDFSTGAPVVRSQP